MFHDSWGYDVELQEFNEMYIFKLASIEHHEGWTNSGWKTIICWVSIFELTMVVSSVISFTTYLLVVSRWVVKTSVGRFSHIQ